MRRINIFPLYELGKSLRSLETLSEQDCTSESINWLLWGVRSNIQSIISNEDLSLKICRKTAEQFIFEIGKIVPENILDAINKQNKSEEINWWEIQGIKRSAQKFETVLAEELALMDTYAVTQKGAYSITELVSNAEIMFSKPIQDKLPKRALDDIHEAGKCLAFETPTAAAFHIVRAIESVILRYYTKILEQPPPAKMRNWGVYISALRKSGKADAKIVDLLAHIKDSYRNPVSHPEATLTLEEVLVLLGVAVSAMTQMALQL